MALIGFKCPSSTPTAGRENIGVEACIECPHACAPIGVIYCVWRQEGENPHKGDVVSPTSLPRCPRKLKLSRTVDYFIEPMSRYDATRGSLYHSFVQMEGVEDIVTEKRVYKVVTKGPQAPWVISGGFDQYWKSRRKLEDYKTTSEASLDFLFNTGPKEDHVAQLSVYRWLLDGGHLGALDGPQIFWPVDEAQLHYLTMRGAYSSGTRFQITYNGKNAPNYGRKYKYEVERKAIGKNRRGTPITGITIALPAVQLWSLEETEAYVIAKGPTLVRGFREPDFMPPGVMDDPDNAWECGYCDVVSQCQAIESKTHELRWLNEPSLFDQAADSAATPV